MNNENKKIKLYSYSKVWTVEKKIYAIQNIVLPVPIKPYALLSFGGGIVFMLLVGKLIPAIAAIPSIIRFAIIPYGISNYFMKKKLDGKNPIKYFVGCIRYLIKDRNVFLEGFTEHSNYAETAKVKLNWSCSQGFSK